VLAVAVAVAYGVEVGPYWVTDMLVFAVLAGAVAYFCFVRGAKTTSLASRNRLSRLESSLDWRQVTEPDQRDHVSRSRIAHYVIVSRIKSTAFTAWLRRVSDSPFERALLGEPRWRTFSGESLEEITRKTPDASAKSAQ
jgi:hypothetical protein